MTTVVELTPGQIVTVDWRRDPLDPAQDPHPPELAPVAAPMEWVEPVLVG